MAQIELGISRGQLVNLVYGQDALAASQADVQLPVAIGETGQAVDGHTMPFAGSVVGISGDLSAAGSAGSLTVGATVNGTEIAATTQTVTTGTAFRARFGRDAHRFAAGARLGAEITTDASWNGIAADLAVVVWVLLDLDGV